MGNGCSSNSANVVQPQDRSNIAPRNVAQPPRYHEVPDEDESEFTVRAWSEKDGQHNTGLMKSSSLDKLPHESVFSRPRTSSGVSQQTGEEIREQARLFEEYGNDVAVTHTTQEEKDFRKDLRLYTTLFGTLEARDLIFEWNDRFELGITFVDKQHFKLVQLMNELHHAEKTESQRWIIGYVLEKLIQYTDYHFKAEEEVMDRLVYDADVMEVHKQKHRDFVNKVVDFRDKFQNMQELDLGMVILEFLKNWLANHILHTDVKMCQFIKGKIDDGSVPDQ